MEEKIFERIKEKLYMGETDSGLKVFYVEKKDYTNQYSIFSTNYGSNDNIFRPIGEEDMVEFPEGIAHFLEHKLFEDEEENVFERFSALGIDLNAYTTFNQTSYLFSSTDNFYEGLENLVSFVQKPYFTEENVNKEKGIIGQEISMYEDSIGWRAFFNCLNAMYTNHPVKIDIAGSKESIERISKEDLYRAYNTFYHPKNMFLFVIGDLSFEKIMELVNNVERKDYQELKNIHKPDVKEPLSIKTTYVEEKMETATPVFYIGIKDIDLGYKSKEDVKKSMVTNIMLDMLLGNSSSLYEKLYNEGLIDSSFGSYYTGKEDYGHSLIVGQSENPERLFSEIKNISRENPREILTLEDFERMKKKEIGDFIMSLDSIEYIANGFSSLYFQDFLFFDYLDLLEDLEYEDLIDRFTGHFKEENMVLSVIKPLEGEVE